jgi:hypothetical protein
MFSRPSRVAEGPSDPNDPTIHPLSGIHPWDRLLLDAVPWHVSPAEPCMAAIFMP